jgi:hypothetical protein
MNGRRVGIIFIFKVSEENDCKMCCYENYSTSGGCLVRPCGCTGSDQIAPDKAVILFATFTGTVFQCSGTAQGLFTEKAVHMHILFQPNLMASDEYKRGERTEQLGDSPKTEFQVRPRSRKINVCSGNR